MLTGNKAILAILIGILAFFTASAQDRPAYMQPKQFNLSYFYPDVEVDRTAHPELFPDSLKGHPDFGVLPHNTPCYDCVEEIGKRTAYDRYFVDTDSKSEFYVQSSYFPIHYKNDNGYVVSIDPRLKPVGGPHMYLADKQPIPTRYNTKTGGAGIKTNATWFEHNSNLAMGVVGNADAPANRGRQSVGSNGTYISNAWPGVDIQQVFKAGSIKTDYILKSNPGLQSGEWLYFSDALDVPEGWKIKLVDGEYVEGYWAGAIEFYDDKGNVRIRYKRPAYYDGYGYGGPGFYKISQPNNHKKLEIWTVVPASMLNDPQVRYPFYIDPIVEGEDSLGNYASGFGPGNNGANMAFSTTPQTCDYSLMVTVPGMSEIVETYFGVEYENTFSPTCGNPPLPAPYCTFNDVRMEIVSIECGTRTGQLTCDPASPPFIGTCTTDSNLVPIAREILYANFLNCIPPQCPDYELNFRLENRELQCGETCGYNCASGHMFMVTIKARTIENVATISRDTICAGDTVTLTSFPDWGVPPYTYEWTPGGFTDSQVVTTAEIPTIFTVIARDVCGNEAVPQDVFVLINEAPTADAGEDQTLCKGESPGGLGGSPTTTSTANPTYQWSANPAFANSWIDNPTGANPNFLVPADSTGTYELIVRVDDPLCYRRDTVVITIVDDPQPNILPDTAIVICAGEPVTISLDTTYASYNWSNGESGSSITISAAGSYIVTVTDDNGCTGVSNTATATEKPLLEFDLFADPDSSINLGESTSLNATVDLEGPQVEIYAWSPDVSITCLNCPTPIVSPEADQVYVLELTSDGCVVRDSILINVVYPNAYWIPSAFSPDRNGFNDRFFIIKESGVTVELFQVFNRWGEKVHDATLPWDGTFKGELQDLDVYTYIFKLRLADGQEIVESGNVTLVK